MEGTAAHHTTPGELLLRGGRILGPAGWLEEADVLARNGRIVAAGRGVAAQAGAVPVLDVAGCTVLPGFIDLHVHGGAGSDVMDASREGLRGLLAYHARGGTTALLATTATSAPATLLAALDCIATVQRDQESRLPEGADVLGAHVEGPYLSPARPGCHLPQFVRAPWPEDYQPLLERSGVVRHMTLAPELAGALDLIERLAAAGITPAMGHTEAIEPLVRAAMARGLRHATHLYNAMAGAAKVGLYRVPGALEVALAEDALTAEVIADGHHVAPTLLRLALKAKGATRLCVVTDAMRAAGMPDGEWRFGGADGTPVAVHGGVARTLDGGSLASSVTPMDAMVRFLVQQVGLPLEQVATSASTTPARVANVDDRKGSLAAGKDADVVVLDANLRVVLTAVRGHIVYRRAALDALSSAGGAL